MSSKNFNWKQYVKNYKDLRIAGINTEIQAWEHWLNHGKAEYRTDKDINNVNTTETENTNKNNSNDDFDWVQYVENYKDLREAGINNKELALQHWLYNGKAENRSYKKIKNIDSVDDIYTDPVKKYLNDLRDIKLNRKKPLIGIDCQPIQHEYRGIGRYCVNLINKIIEKNTKYDIVLIFNNFIDTIYYRENVSKLKLKDIKTVTCNFNIKNDLTRKLNTTPIAELIIEEQYANLIDSLCLDIFINLSEFDITKVSFVRSLSKNKYMKTFSVVHDLIPLDSPDKFLKEEKVKQVYFKHFQNLKTYDALLSNSNSTMKRVEICFKNVYTIGTGVNFDIKKDLSNEQISNILNKYGIKKSYLFFQSSYDLHKGFDLALEQYSKLDNDVKNNLQLVFGTNYLKEYVPNHLKQVYEENLNNKNLIVTGRLSDEELSALHTGAWLFFFPSENEGFGLPIVEAWVHNKPVIVAKNSSMIEIMNDDRFMFERNDSLSNLIKNLYYDKNLYNECLKKSERKNLFTWDVVYDNLEQVLNKQKISIVSLIKNNEKWFEYFDSYITGIENRKEYMFEYFFYENNSTDNSKKLIQSFMECRLGKYLCENIDNPNKWTNPISPERGLWMTQLRNKIKRIHGILNSDYTFVIDSNITFTPNTINDFIKTFENDNTISVVSPYTKCVTSASNHYYDSLALRTLSGLNYLNTGNTCPFKHCKRCIRSRNIKRTKIDDNQLLDINDKIIDVSVVFGGCSMYPTKYYNIYNYDSNTVLEKKLVCEHFDFVEKFRENGRIVINSDIRLSMQTS